MKLTDSTFNFQRSTINGQSSIKLQIERLVVDASLFRDGQTRGLQAAIETELTELIRREGLSGLTSGALYSLPARDMHVAEKSRTTQLGQQIARTVYGALRPESAPRQDRHRTVH